MPQLGQSFSRRQLLKSAACGFGSLALAGMQGAHALTGNPLAAKTSLIPQRAKRVIFIFMAGGPSHVDTFDYKPDLTKFHGQKPPGMPAVTFEGPSGNIAKPFWEFKPRGASGKMTSELLPNLGALADDFCFLHGLHTQTSAHPQGENFFNTGFTMEGFPSFGAWVTYALGSENAELPAFVAINDPRGLARSGKNNFGNGFLPAAFQGTDFNAKNPPANLARPVSYTQADDRSTVDLLKHLNDRHLKNYPGDANLAARIASYELAGRMQTSVPEVMDVSGEPDSIQREYGTGDGSDLKREYAKNCILARRLIEKGVRVVQLFNGSDPSGGNGITNWDSHSNILKTHAMQAEIMDQPTAALIHDLKRRGLLDHTLVVWCTEFGRMPSTQGRKGRDHNPYVFTNWLCGGGIQRGVTAGESDEWGCECVDGMQIFDITACHPISWIQTTTARILNRITVARE